MDPGRGPRGTFSPVAFTDRPPPLGRWLALAAIALVLLLVKPWQPAGQGDEGSGAGGSRGNAPLASNPGPAPAPTSTESADRQAVAAFCLQPGAWLVASVERWRDQRIRVWRALTPASAARGPDDPSIPVVAVVSEGLTELGWCAPVSGEDIPSAPVAVTVWLRGPGAAGLIVVDSSRPDSGPSPFGDLYRPPSGSPGSRAASWSPGTYVFRYREHDGRVRWFAIAIEIRHPPIPVPSPVP
jgi:hypothetical protein